jgi:diamine N-acetyltransferase
MTEKTLTNQTEIRSADSHDIDTLSNIIRTANRDVAKRFNLTVDNCPKHPSNCSNEWIIKDLHRNVAYYMLSNHQKPVGCIALEHASPEMCYIERLSVLPESRKNGFGNRLVYHAMDRAAALGVNQVGIGIIAEFTELKEWYKKIVTIHGIDLANVA